MNGSDLLALVPWLLFGAGLGMVCFRLISARHWSRRVLPPREGREEQGREEPGDSLGAAPRPPQQAGESGQHGAGPP